MFCDVQCIDKTLNIVISRKYGQCSGPCSQFVFQIVLPILLVVQLVTMAIINKSAMDW